MGEAAPRVRVVTVDYNGTDLTLRCLAALRATEWPHDRLELLLVDNGSTDGIAERVRSEHPETLVIEIDVNRGFAGGYNLGLQSLEGVDYVALVNNDAVVPPGWLRPLVDALEGDETLGAACPKILFESPYRRVRLRVTRRSARARRREIGVCVVGARVGDSDVSGGLRFAEGFWGPERLRSGGAARWSRESATLLVPAPGAPGAPCALRLGACGDATVEVECDGRVVMVEVGPGEQWFDTPFEGATHDLVNNAGSELDGADYGVDRGYLEADAGQYDTACDVFAWCGAAVLLRADYVRDVGLLDERLFLYYEDLELSWRGRRHGWRYRYVPESVVRHLHSATTVADSPMTQYYSERNRLAVLSRHAEAPRVWRALGRYVQVTLSYGRRDLMARLGARCMPDRHRTLPRLRALGGYLRLAPAMLRDRRR